MKIPDISDIFDGIGTPERKNMDLDELIETRGLLDEIASSVRNIVFRTFSRTTPEEREDIEQEVKLKLWKKIINGKKVENLRSYLWKVVYTTALDVVEERIRIESRAEMIEQNEKVTIERLEILSPEIIVELKEKNEALKRYIDGLAPRRKSVLKLHLSGMDLEEIAGHLGLTENQARHLLYRGIDDLAEAMNRRGAIGGATGEDMKRGRGSK